MRKKIVLLAGAIFSLLSCDKAEMIEYTGGTGIYFAGTQMSDTVSYSWANSSGDIEKAELSLTVQLFGKTVDYPRPFEIELITDSNIHALSRAVEGEDYEAFLLNYELPANEASLDINIGLIRNPILKEGNIRILSFKLKENEHFEFLYNRYFKENQVTQAGDTIPVIKYIDTHRTIKMSETVTIQHWWTPVYESELGHNDLGIWSVKKSLYVCDYMELDRKLWLSGDLIPPVTEAYIKFIGKKVHRHLQEMKADGKPVLEKDGMEMEMGPDAKL